jgi:hypothetical protein
MSTLTDTGQGYDVAINGLGFKLAVSDDRPYERATAQFRKEQFDSSQNYGDQSLLGYWTRGQFSFHKGAGVKFYEASDDTVFNRYKDSVGVNPFTTPGEASLYPAWTGTTDQGSFTVVRWGGSGNGFLAYLEGTSLKYATSLTGTPTTYTPTAGTVTNATVGPLCAYVATSSNKIERVGIASGAPASAAIYTHSTGFLGIFYAKDRLWAVDQNGVWYQLSPNPTAPPVAIAAGDKVFTAGDGWDGNWSLTDTPGPVLIGIGGHIYSVTLDSSTGAVPAMSGPVQVAELPTGEAIRGLAYHLGFLAINTNLGVRIGIVSDAGQVTYGPLLIKWPAAETGSTTIARQGSSVVVAGDASLYEIDLSEQVGDTLEFGWAKLPDPYTTFTLATNHLYGAFTWAGTTLVAWAGRALPSSLGSLRHQSTDFTTTGNLTTGFHRLGTLEPKAFRTVRVRIAGTGGTIAIYRVDADATETLVTTLTVGVATDFEYPLGLTSPVEMIGLKFVLTRGSATTGPILLGYQIRALPAPKRQRLIRLPLMLMDVERRGPAPAVGYEGSAWDRLKALEDMEQSGGVFDFQDLRTGETGEVFIESVEHQGKTPPGTQNNGFGGVVFLTVRKL